MSGDDQVLPAYGRRSLAELTPSLLAALGASGNSNELGIEPAGRICLLLIDGMGAQQLAAHAADAPFLSSLLTAEPLTAGFPSSTPVSLSSIGTGAPPGAHGVLGVSFEASHGEVLDSIKWTTHRGGSLVDMRKELPPEEVQPLDTAFGRASAGGVDVRVVSSYAFRDSGLTRAALRGGQYRGVHALGDLAAELITALNAEAPVFCYGYHSNLDTLGHVYGPGSLPWRLELTVVDQVAALVAESLPPDGLLVVTADHGMVDIPPAERIDADTDDALRAGVRLLGGDPRSRHVYAEPGAADDVLAAWTERLGPRAWVLPGEQAIADGWFGPIGSAAARSRIGDVVVALRGTAAVTRSHAEPMLSQLPGQHGSLTGAEQRIPLLQVRGS
ncbi:alkaline phosphatase family protein [Pseudonocardia spinosispora]|uniref:alkaline phosphatase family protein n=1 Tax=Pseudonocardia spinosispora TaxID=103441 RepID=UPI000406A819|nr:alkaline phosphatase family protein [Pseudonocardia spinosispora]